MSRKQLGLKVITILSFLSGNTLPASGNGRVLFFVFLFANKFLLFAAFSNLGPYTSKRTLFSSIWLMIMVACPLNDFYWLARHIYIFSTRLWCIKSVCLLSFEKLFISACFFKWMNFIPLFVHFFIFFIFVCNCCYRLFVKHKMLQTFTCHYCYFYGYPVFIFSKTNGQL